MSLQANRINELENGIEVLTKERDYLKGVQGKINKYNAVTRKLDELNRELELIK